MNLVVYFVLTIGCGILCLLASLGFIPAPVAIPVILLISGYSLLGPAFAAHSRGIEFLGVYLGVSVAISILIGIGLSRLGIGITSRSMYVSYAVIFGLAALVWALVGAFGSATRIDTVRPRLLSRAQLASSVAAITVASLATVLLFTAPPRGDFAIELGLRPHPSLDTLQYQPGQQIEFKAHIVLNSSVSPTAVLEVLTNSGQSLMIELRPNDRAQTMPVMISAPGPDSPNLVVTAVVRDGGVAISSAVRVNMRPTDTRQGKAEN